MILPAGNGASVRPGAAGVMLARLLGIQVIAFGVLMAFAALRGGRCAGTALPA